MRNDRLIPGLILVLIGLVVLFDNLGYIDFYWPDLWHLWPLFLIVAGVNLVFANSHSALTSAVKIIVVIAAFAFVMVRYADFGPRSGMHNTFSWHHRDHDNDDDDNDDRDNSDTTSNDDNDTTGSKGVVKIASEHNFSTEYTPNAKFAELNISGGASSYVLNDTTNQLFKADTREHWGRYEFWPSLCCQNS